MKLQEKYLGLHKKLSGIIPEQNLLTDNVSTFALGTDASFYRLTPKLVVKANDENEIILILKVCSELNIPVTFRAAGTSLSGQAVTDSVLVMIGNSWKSYAISDDASKISLQPGIIGGHANNYLAQYKKKIGPDPASINAAMIGGIAANNASGMCCGTSQNSYKTLGSMRIVFANGDVLDTNHQKNISDFVERNPALIKNIITLRNKINSDVLLRDKIIRKYKIKNTTGYSLNAFVDFEDPVEIIQHLVIGSEGTLGFISEITLNTVPDYEYKATSLVLFKNIQDACKAASLLKQLPVDAAELMDRNSIRSVENKNGMPELLKELDNESAALLIETKAENKFHLNQNIDCITNTLSDFDLLSKASFTKDKLEYTKLWNIRKGLFPSVGASRRTGTSVIIEDIAFPLDSLSSAVIKLRNILNKYNFADAIIFGHALEGNLHFVFSQDFSIKSEIERYDSMMNEISQMVVGEFDGSLKAEHGTGRNMAPFVEYEWGPEAYSIMKQIKNIFDPKNILNPGVILNDDKEIHLKNLKTLPAVDELIDKCTECGFCESRCVSEGLTFSPRQRISALRSFTGENRKKVFDTFKYQVEETCVADGLCSVNCPVGIDTGSVVKKLRAKDRNGFSKKIAEIVSSNFSFVSLLIKFFLNVLNFSSKIIGKTNLENITNVISKISKKKIPGWNQFTPPGNSFVVTSPMINLNKPKVVYFPSCINRTFGNSEAEKADHVLIEKTISLLHKAGYEILFPDNLNNLCCGLSFVSKGFVEAGDSKLSELMNELKIITNNFELPVLSDMSPCFHRIKTSGNSMLKIYEPAEFTLLYLKDKLVFEKTDEAVAIYPTCSTQLSGLTEKLKETAELCSSNVFMPDVNCCGFAGDKGFTHPELNDHGLRTFKKNLPENCLKGFSTSRTCEIGLNKNTGIPFKSIFYLVDKHTTVSKKG
ncbi:MAG: FAD-binding oxidoreductase [Ignavibacteriales bacterium]|nr:MAG: FAD-binding oxidoreductase [Ignavibacteriales bacterium]